MRSMEFIAYPTLLFTVAITIYLVLNGIQIAAFIIIGVLFLVLSDQISDWFFAETGGDPQYYRSASIGIGIAVLIYAGIVSKL